MAAPPMLLCVGRRAELYEGGIRVPFLMRWVGRLPAGQRVDSPVFVTDIAATAMAAAGTSGSS